MPRIEPQQVAVGFAGAMTDVTSYADLDAGVDFGRGRKSDFDETRPSEFSFVLDNADGRFTPDNAASALPEPLSEGMTASWLAGSRLVSGRVREIKPLFPGDESAWAQVRLTCDDDLGGLARQDVRSLTEGMIYGATAYAYWPFDDAAGSTTSRELSGYSGSPNLRQFGDGVLPEFGVSGVPAVGLDQIELSAEAGSSSAWIMSAVGGLSTGLPPSLGVSGGWLGLWITPMNKSSYFRVRHDTFTPEGRFIGIQNDQFVFSSAFAGVTLRAPFTVGQAYYLALNGSDVYLDGVLVGNTVGGDVGEARAPSLTIGDAAYGESVVRVSQFSHTANQVHAEWAAATTETNRLTAIDSASSATFSLSSTLSERPVGVQGSGSALDLTNEVITTEQGHLYTTTSGTLTAPVQTINVRERTRPTTVTYTFDVEDDLDGAPEFVRDLTDMLSAVTVDGPDSSVLVNSTGTYTNAQLVTRVGSSNDSEDILNTSTVDLTAWGEDRLNRGANVALRVAELTIDAMTTPTDRSADLLGMTPGDRIQITGLPSTQLGFDTWDGWLLGVDETHTTEEHTFTLYLAPVLPDPAVFDVSRFSDDGELTLSANINSAVTTMSVASSDTAAALLTTDATDMPFNLLLDSEEVTVTAVTSATPQVVTMTRAANGTTAAAHTLGAVVSLAETEATADTLIEYNYAPDPAYASGFAMLAVENAGGGAFTFSQQASGASPSGFVGRFTVAPGSPTTGACVLYIQAVMPELVTGDAFVADVSARGSIPITARIRMFSNANANGTGAQTAFDGADVVVPVPGTGAFTALPTETGTVDASRLSMRMAVRISTILPAGTTIDFNMAKVSDIAGSWFNGSTANTADATHWWDGPTNASPSVRATGGRPEPLYAF